MKKQTAYKAELLAVLKSVSAKIVGDNEAEWLIHFEVNGIPFHVFYDDGIDCSRFGKPFYHPLEWGEPYFSRFKEMLLVDLN
jgi:hypothetical protein